MPNWCSNSVCLQHEDPEMIKRVERAFNNGTLLEEFFPVPADLKNTVAGTVNDPAETAKRSANMTNHGYADWYDFCVNEWGTKWDVGGSSDPEIGPDGLAISMEFDSAWSPPIAAFEKFEELGFRVTAYYYESGMGYAGIYDEMGDDYYQLSDMTSDEVRNNIPQELDAIFGISDSMEEWEKENEEPLTEWYTEGVEETGLIPHEVKKDE